ncbi:MAG TPA: hypothetical protein VHE30_06705 [Polyangiaceae bacterium]|nr:hypothetical protein [Polyangiaceae bacterium]
MRWRSVIVVATVSGGLAAGGCAGTLEGDEASYRIVPEPGCDVVPVFEAHCASPACHGGSTPQQGLDLASIGVRSRLLGVHSKSTGCEDRFLVDPADVNESFLLEKLESGSPSCGDPMPLTGEISDDEKACIRTWAVAVTGGPKDAGASAPGDASPGPGSVDSGAGSAGDSGGSP